jgi:cytochrome c-type biogenesis protein CcmH
MTLWLILSLMTAAAIFAVLWPLSRRGSVVAEGHDIAVYRDQLAEVERDRKLGLIGEAESQAAKLEISRRLLAAADQVESAEVEPNKAEAKQGSKAKSKAKSRAKSQAASQPSAEGAARLWRRRAAALIALIALPALSAVLYMKWGSPHLRGMPLAARQDLPLEQRSIESMVAQVEAHLEQRPNDGRGWEVVGPVYMKMGRFDDAVRARANSLRLLGATASRESDLGEAQTAAANGVVTAEARQSFERALKLDAGDLRAQYFMGLAALQDGRPPEAIRIWRTLLENAPANAPYRRLVQQSLARIDPQAAQIEPKAPQSGPNQEDIKAAEQLTPEQRAEMVRGMIERLADRLKADGSDFDGWIRLVRAYVVMGDADRAREALTNARKTFGSDAEKKNRLDALAESLGIKG